MTREYEARLLAAVEQEPGSPELPFSNWTTANLASYMAEKAGIVITPRQVENYLKANDWHLRRPVRTVKHRQDPELVAEKKQIAELMARAGPNLVILFADSAEVSTFPTITRCWTRRGE